MAASVCNSQSSKYLRRMGKILWLEFINILLLNEFCTYSLPPNQSWGWRIQPHNASIHPSTVYFAPSFRPRATVFPSPRRTASLRSLATIATCLLIGTSGSNRGLTGSFQPTLLKQLTRYSENYIPTCRANLFTATCIFTMSCLTMEN